MAEEQQAEGTRPGGSKTTRWLIGCAVGLVVLSLVCGGLAWAAFVWGKGLMADFIHGTLSEMVEESGLPPEQVGQMLDDLSRLRTAFEEDRIDMAEIERLVDELESGPLLSLGALHAFDARVLVDAELTDGERADAQRVVQRVARGLQETSVEPLDVRDLLAFGFDDGPDDTSWGERWATPADVLATVTELRALADAAGVPDEPFQTDVAAEFAKLVDELVD